MTEFLTNREAAWARLEGKELEWRHSSGSSFPATHVRLRMNDDDIDKLTHYCIKPEFITVNGIQVPKPESEELVVGKTYWLPSISTEGWASVWIWNNDSDDRRRLSRGLIHKTEAAAVKHAKAMCGVEG